MAKIKVQESDVAVFQIDSTDYISLSDMAKQRDAIRTDYIIQNWIRTRFALEFLGLWEHNKIILCSLRTQIYCTQAPKKLM